MTKFLYIYFILTLTLFINGCKEDEGMSIVPNELTYNEVTYSINDAALINNEYLVADPDQDRPHKLYRYVFSDGKIEISDLTGGYTISNADFSISFTLYIKKADQEENFSGGSFTMEDPLAVLRNEEYLNDKTFFTFCLLRLDEDGDKIPEAITDPSGGTVIISGSDDEFTIDMDLDTETSKKIKAHYQGKFQVK